MARYYLVIVLIVLVLSGCGSSDSGTDFTPKTRAVPPGGTYTSPQTVSLEINPSGMIHYTTDGSSPTTSSPLYTVPITIASNTTLRFFGVRIGYEVYQEAVHTEVYTFVP